MSLRTYALGGGFGCLALAAFVQGVLPMLEPQSRHSKVTSVVRTDLGELKWMEAQATDYTELQAHGRAVYTREGCWYRSEEHTSELQSLMRISYAVFCLKKKKY